MNPVSGIRFYSRTDTMQDGQKNLPIEVRVTNSPPLRGRGITSGTLCGRFRIKGIHAGETYTLHCSSGPIQVNPGSTFLTLQANGPVVANIPDSAGHKHAKNFLMVGEVQVF